MFVRCYTSKVPHFGNRLSSRIEGMHHYVKRFIKSSTGSLATVVRQIHNSMINTLHEYWIEATQQTDKRLFGLPSCVQHLNGQITQYALRICSSLNKSNDDSECLNCNYHAHMGIPCVHRIKRAVKSGEQLSVDDFHKQWTVRKFDPVSGLIQL